MLCADVGGSFTTFSVFTASAGLGPRRRVRTPTRDFKAFLAAILAVEGLEGGLLEPQGPLTISLSGLVDPDTGTTTSANVPCVAGRALAADLAGILGRPVLVTNDADCFALAEATLGAGRDHRRVFGLILGTGVGGGLVENGRLLAGPGGVCGEWGHGPVITPSRADPRATPYFRCGCGQWGCLDTVGAARGLERLHVYLHGARAGSRQITRRWRAGEAQAQETVDLYLMLVSGPLAAMVNALGATAIPVGGGLASDTRLIAALDLEVRRKMLKPPHEPLLRPTVLGRDAGLLGAALAAGAPSIDLARRPLRKDRDGGSD